MADAMTSYCDGHCLADDVATGLFVTMVDTLPCHRKTATRQAVEMTSQGLLVTLRRHFRKQQSEPAAWGIQLPLQTGTWASQSHEGEMHVWWEEAVPLLATSC